MMHTFYYVCLDADPARDIVSHRADGDVGPAVRGGPHSVPPDVVAFLR